MASTLTAVAIDGGTLTAAHVGDCRLYLLRERARGAAQPRSHAGRQPGEDERLQRKKPRANIQRGTLTRCLGPELIVAIDRITTPLVEGDVVVLCSDGVHTILDAARSPASDRRLRRRDRVSHADR